MIELKPDIECDVCMSSVEMCIALLGGYRPKRRVFFVVLTHEYRVFSRETERYSNQGYDAVFWQPSADLPTPYAWTVVMYDTATGEAIVCVKNQGIN